MNSSFVINLVLINSTASDAALTTKDERTLHPFLQKIQQKLAISADDNRQHAVPDLTESAQPLNGCPLSVTLVGDFRDPEFSDIVWFLQQCSHVGAVDEFASLHDFLNTRNSQSNDVDLAVVFQSWSDQYSADEINELIGKMMFRRLISCQGVWCASDGRTRDHWPPLVRTPVWSACAVLQQMILQIRSGADVRPPTSSPEEVFSARVECFINAPFSPRHSSGNTRRGLVLSNDVPFRDTACSILEAMQFKAVANSWLVDQETSEETTEHSEHCTGMADAISQLQPELVLHSLDGPDDLVRCSLQQVRKITPSAMLCGITGFPHRWAAGRPEFSAVDRLLHPFDLVNGLRFLAMNSG